VSVSCLEIYNEALRDLMLPPLEGSKRVSKPKAPLSTVPPNDLNIRDINGAITVTGLREELVVDAAQLLALLEAANMARATSATNCNEQSSRSHSVYSISIEGRHTGSACAARTLRRGCLKLRVHAARLSICVAALMTDLVLLIHTRCWVRASLDTGGKRTHGKVHLIDLAGSENPKESGVVGESMAEAKAINKSLASLGDVIAALGDRKKKGGTGHVPFRNSKLTRVLESALSGTAKTLMFVNINPLAHQESASSLRFAAKVNRTEVAAAKR
jgi:kinesin family protein C1